MSGGTGGNGGGGDGGGAIGGAGGNPTLAQPVAANGCDQVGPGTGLAASC